MTRSSKGQAQAPAGPPTPAAAAAHQPASVPSPRSASSPPPAPAPFKLEGDRVRVVSIRMEPPAAHPRPQTVTLRDGVHDALPASGGLGRVLFINFVDWSRTGRDTP